MAIVALALIACGRAPTPEPVASERAPPERAATDASPPDIVAAPAPTIAGDRRASVFFRASNRARATVWHVGRANPDVGVQLPLVVDHDGVDAPDTGTSNPLLSTNGVWLAYLDAGHLWVASLDGSTKRRITKHGPSQVGVLITGFSPDSSSLLYAQHEVEAPGGLPLPADVVAGFQLLSLVSLKSKPLTELPSFTGWSAGSTRVLFEHARVDGDTELLALDLVSADTKLLQRTTPAGYADLTIAGEQLAYVRTTDGLAQVIRTSLDGSKVVPLSEAGEPERFASPSFSPDATKLAFFDDGELVTVGFDGGASTPVLSCSACVVAWESSSTLLVLERRKAGVGVLTRHGLDGGRTELATDAVGFAVAGVPW